jgi:hypothetical protein
MDFIDFEPDSLWYQVCQEAWNTMRNLLGTHLGHSALYNLCQIIQTSTSSTDIALIRGAVFFIGTRITCLLFCSYRYRVRDFFSSLLEKNSKFTRCLKSTNC